jgi:regulatory protein
VRKPKKVQKLSAEELFDYAVKLLAGRACSSAELAAKLRLKAERAADVDTTIARLKDLKYLDDARFAESFANARVENSGFGRMRVLNDLRARRVSSKLADRAVATAYEGREEDELIDAYIARRLPRLAADRAAAEGEDRAAADRKMASAYRRLQRAGFRSGAILAALKRLGAPADMEELPDEEEAEG